MGMFDDLPKEPSTTQTAAPSAGLFDDLPKEPAQSEGAISRTLRVGREVGHGIITAPITMLQGLAELGASGLDLALDTNTSRPTTEFFNTINRYVAPETLTGKVANEITAFGAAFLIPAGWLNVASKAAKVEQLTAAAARGQKLGELAQLSMRYSPATGRFMKSAEAFGKTKLGQAALTSKAGIMGSTALTAGAFETIFSPDGRATLSDAFDIVAPLKTEADTGLTGRDEALRKLRNKLRHGVWGAGASLAFDGVLNGLGLTAKAVGKTETAATVARGIRSGASAVREGLGAVPGMNRAISTVRRFTAPLGGAPSEIATRVFDSIARADAVESRSLRLLAGFDKKLKTFVRSSDLPKGKATYDQAERRMFNYLNGLGPRLTEYGEDVAKAADDLRDNLIHINGQFLSTLERELKAAPIGSKRSEVLKDAIDKIRLNVDSQQGQLRRLFKVHKDPIAFFRTLKIEDRGPEQLSAALNTNPATALSQYEEAVVEVSRNLHGVEYATPGALAAARHTVNRSLGLEGLNTGASPEMAIKAKLADLVSEAKTGPKTGLFSRAMPRMKLTPSLTIAREKIVSDSPKLRALMGEITDPRQAYIQTVADTAKTTASLNFYRNITDDASRLVTPLADAVPAIHAGQRPLFVRTPDMANDATGFDLTPFSQRAQELNILETTPTKAAEDAAARIPPGLTGRHTPESVIDSFSKELETAGYVKLGSMDNLDSAFVGQYGSLTGVYVAPEAYQAVTAATRIGFGIIDDVLGVLRQLQSVSQKMTIVFNPESQSRNVLANSFGLFATGNAGRSTNLYDVYRVFTTGLADLSDAGLERLANKIAESGTSESSLVIKALQEMRTEGQNLGATGYTRTGIEFIESKLPFSKFLQTFYSNSDSFFKGVALVSEENKLLMSLAKALEKVDESAYVSSRRALTEDLRLSGIASRTRNEANPSLTSTEVIAADIVKNIFPVYNRVGAFVSSIDKYPIIGNFMSFASENIRNSVNIIDHGLKEMSYTVSPVVRQQVGEEAAKTFEQSIRAMGAHRLMSFVTMAGIVPAAAVKTSAALSGTTPEQQEALYRQLPEYTKGQDIFILSNDQRGRIEYYNLSSILPYSFAVDPAKAALRAYNNSGVLGKNEAEQIFSGVWAAVSSYANPFVSQAMSTEKLLDVLPLTFPGGRGGQTVKGARVYFEGDSRSTKIMNSVNHITAAFLPGYLREVYGVKSGEWRPGSITRAMTDTVGPQSQQYDASAEFSTFVTGLRAMELNLRRDFSYSGKEYAPLRQDVRTKAVARIRAADRTPEEMLAGWQTYLDDLYRHQSQLYADIQDARTLGLSDKDIRTSLIKDANLGSDEVNMIMRGKFYPTAVSKEIMKDIRRKDRTGEFERVTPAQDIPLSELNAMSRARKGEALMYVPEPSTGASEPFEGSINPPKGLFDDLPKEAPKGLFDDLPKQRQGAVMPPPTFGSTPALSAPQLPSAPANRASLSPALLGDNPASQMANMEIARRTSG